MQCYIKYLTIFSLRFDLCCKVSKLKKHNPLLLAQETFNLFFITFFEHIPKKILCIFFFKLFSINIIILYLY